MPVKPTSSETEQEFIGRCMGEEKSSFPDNTQRYAVCKSKWDAENMGIELQEESEIDALPEPNTGEAKEKYIMRCIPLIYHQGGKYDQRVAISMCSSKYENSQAQLGGPTHMKSAFERNFEATQLAMAEWDAVQKGIILADYPWEECIKDQTDRYGDEETAAKVCGMIKSKYGSGAPTE